MISFACRTGEDFLKYSMKFKSARMRDIPHRHGTTIKPATIIIGMRY
jgi:hypothetical protein